MGKSQLFWSVDALKYLKDETSETVAIIYGYFDKNVCMIDQHIFESDIACTFYKSIDL